MPHPRIAPLARLLLPLLMALATPALAAEVAAEVQAPAGDARTRALLVGVSAYPALEGVDLQGPANDVALWRDFLRRRGLDGAMRVLADGVDGADGLPTRAAILEALDALAREAREGETVLLLFAGHGSQQPAAAAAAETDGLDEIFLPRDASGWDGGIGGVANAIVDDEFDRAIRAIRARGAFVWAIFDTCHSGTMTRALAPDGLRYRQVRPQQLGIPAEALATAATAASTAAATPLAPGAEPAGGFVAFYAAQSTQQAPEYPQPRGLPGAVPHGAFSYTLLEMVESMPGATYGQLIEAVIQRFRATPAATAVPMAEGTALEAGVLGADGTGLRQFRINNDGLRMRLEAGRLQGLDVGTRLALHATPAPGDATPVAELEIQQADLLSATATPVARGDAPPPRLPTLPTVGFARPMGTAVDLQLQVALAGRASGCEAPGAALRDAATALREDATLPRLRWLADDAGDADLWLCQRDGRVLLTSAATPLVDARGRLLDGDGVPPSDARPLAPGVTLGDPAALRLALAQAARVQALLRISEGAGVPTLEVSLSSRRPGPGDSACGTQAATFEGTGDDGAADAVRELAPGDCLVLRLHNRGRTPVDTTVLYVDGAFGITPLWPDAPEAYNPRIEAGGSVVVGELEAVADAGLLDQLLVLSVPVVQASQPMYLGFLAQDPLAQPPATTRGGGGDVLDLVREAGFGLSTTRSLRPTGAAARLAAHRVVLRVHPSAAGE